MKIRDKKLTGFMRAGSFVLCLLLCVYATFFLKIDGHCPFLYIILPSDNCMEPLNMTYNAAQASSHADGESNDGFIKWMEFNVPLEVMNQALKYDVDSYESDSGLHYNWIELIAYAVAKNWGTLKDGVKSKDIDDLVIKLENGQSMKELTEGMKLYPFYLETYNAVLSEYVGEYEIEQADSDNPEQTIFVKRYGLKVFSPIAKGYSYSHYDDFGVSRTYGYKRKHQGHDLMGSTGTPVIAVEDGYVEALGWNQYGGWRVGIRSFDRQRYYYYAHLQKGHPFHSALEIGSYVKAGDVIGYLGRTGYSAKEDVNNISTPHLHFGIQVIFDESQKDGINQIWIDCYNIIRFLAKNKMPVYKEADSKDFTNKLQIRGSFEIE